MEDKTYDCLTCPYPRHKTPELIFCDVCIRRILEEHDARKAVSKEKSRIKREKPYQKRKAVKRQTNKIAA